MGLEALTMLTAGYWLAESQTKGSVQCMGWERAAEFFQETINLAWHLLVLTGLGWAMQELRGRIPQADSATIGLTLVLAYGLSLLRPRPEGASEPYFLALTALALMAQQTQASSGMPFWGMLIRILSGSLACEVVLLGLKERLRLVPVPHAVKTTPLVLLCLALLALILRCLRP